jgi:carbon-monoxide dehydrogenase medium subunit
VPARAFHTGPYESVVGPAEMLVELRVPIRPGCGSAYEKLDRRAGDWAIAAGGCFISMDVGGVVTEVGIGLTAVGAAHFCCPDAEAALVGSVASDEKLTLAAVKAAEAANPQTDQRGPADYKRHLAGELTKRALQRAVRRATGREP